MSQQRSSLDQSPILSYYSKSMPRNKMNNETNCSRLFLHTYLLFFSRLETLSSHWSRISTSLCASCFSWMLMEGLHVYRLLVDVFQRKQIGKKYRIKLVERYHLNIYTYRQIDKKKESQKLCSGLYFVVLLMQDCWFFKYNLKTELFEGYRSLSEFIWLKLLEA